MLVFGTPINKYIFISNNKLCRYSTNVLNGKTWLSIDYFMLHCHIHVAEIFVINYFQDVLLDQFLWY